MGDHHSRSMMAALSPPSPSPSSRSNNSKHSTGSKPIPIRASPSPSHSRSREIVASTDTTPANSPPANEDTPELYISIQDGDELLSTSARTQSLLAEHRRQTQNAESDDGHPHPLYSSPPSFTASPPAHNTPSSVKMLRFSDLSLDNGVHEQRSQTHPIPRSIPLDQDPNYDPSLSSFVSSNSTSLTPHRHHPSQSLSSTPRASHLNKHQHQHQHLPPARASTFNHINNHTRTNITINRPAFISRKDSGASDTSASSSVQSKLPPLLASLPSRLAFFRDNNTPRSSTTPTDSRFTFAKVDPASTRRSNTSSGTTSPGHGRFDKLSSLSGGRSYSSTTTSRRASGATQVQHMTGADKEKANSYTECGRHGDDWLFGGFSLGGAVKKILDRT